MKYEMLNLYHNYLLEKFSKTTARMYAHRLDILLTGQSLINPLANFDIEKVIENLAKIKHKNHFSQSKNSLLYFCKFQNISVSKEAMNKITSLEEKTKKKYRQLKPACFKTIENKINHLKNDKLRLSYQTMTKTGLRVSELASINLLDCDISECEIVLSFTAKGGGKEVVSIVKSDDTKFFEKLLNLIKATKSDEKIFYCVGYLQKKAKEYGFTSHDLRRGFAKKEYKITKSKNLVMEKLRHKSIKTTNIYLRSKVTI